ncbi:Phosphotyrosyl phosphate activator protein-domain-containing protein [Obelidium mucronatum]|nr:Phosphotyrosyl phosphate activator protein-domain-containing protein [Obelidium mucronatum]
MEQTIQQSFRQNAANPLDLMPRMPPPQSSAQKQPSEASLDVAVDAGVDLGSLPLPGEYKEPTRAITNDALMSQWLKSPALSYILTFISQLNNEFVGKPIPKTPPIIDPGSIVHHLQNLLATLNAWIADFPPQDVSMQRFGNKAFRSWVDRLEERAVEVISPLLPQHLLPATVELVPYLTAAFGHKTRLDYGSGHELSFVCFLCCLRILKVVEQKDMSLVAFMILPAYFELARNLQRTYTLEPAGSHGVWGLDDHQFLCYFWGAAQLVNHRNLKPKSVLQRDIVDCYAQEFMYLRAIQYIYEVKSGPFHEHSPMLYDITGVISWSKVNSGMMKMYVAEVIKKFPVVQHIPFGAILPFSHANESIIPTSFSTDSTPDYTE